MALNMHIQAWGFSPMFLHDFKAYACQSSEAFEQACQNGIVEVALLI
jgi:hypothetical protein